MATKRTPPDSNRPANTEKTSGKESASRAEREGIATQLVELRTGLLINPDHIVSIRVLPDEEELSYAVMQLSNGDKVNLTADEYRAISGNHSRWPSRLPQSYWGKKLPSQQ